VDTSVLLHGVIFYSAHSRVRQNLNFSVHGANLTITSFPFRRGRIFIEESFESSYSTRMTHHRSLEAGAAVNERHRECDVEQMFVSYRILKGLNADLYEQDCMLPRIHAICQHGGRIYLLSN
jgi:hypothetical protein